MILSGDKPNTEQKINALLGKPLTVDLRHLKPIGSTGFFLKSFTNKTSSEDSIEIDSRCNFEKRTQGLLLRSNLSGRRKAVTIPEDQLIEIKIVRGEEVINPALFSPMWILLKLGVSKLIARYFSSMGGIYTIDQMEVYITTISYELYLIANGYLFERQLDFFETLDYKDKLVVEIKN